MRLTKKDVCFPFFIYSNTIILFYFLFNLILRIIKNLFFLFKVTQGQYVTVEEFFVKYKN